MNTPTQTTLYFLPGWCLGRGPWADTAQALQTEGVASQIIDLPGYADTPLITDFDEAVAQLAAQLSDQSIVSGWSLGAMLALAIAARFPQKVRKLVLVAGTASFVQREGWPFAMPAPTLAEFCTAMAADAAAMFPRFVGGFNRGDEKAKEVTQTLLTTADPLPATEVLLTGLRWLEEVDLRPLAPHVAVPTLLCHGAADPLMPQGAVEALQALIPSSQLALFASCAHAPFVSQTDAFARQVASFIRGDAA